MFMPGATGDLGQTGVPLIMITGGGGGGCTLTRKTHGQIPLYWCSCLTNYLSFCLFVLFCSEQEDLGSFELEHVPVK